MLLEKAYAIYSKMIQIRLVEEAIVKEYPQQEIRNPVHLYIGQEAIAASISTCLHNRDYVVSNHRSHGHSLAKGMDLVGFFKELYGKQGGVSRGWGGSMHLCDMDLGIIGTSAIVAGGIPIGAGVALKQKIKGEPFITVIYFGDGAVDEGIFWETINFAALKKLPILFVMENNRFATQTPDHERHAYDQITNIIKGFSIPCQKLDGNNAEEIYNSVDKIVEEMRNGAGPYFIECMTYRWFGHVGTVDDSSTGYRTSKEVNHWKERCPIADFEKKLFMWDPDNAHCKIAGIRERWDRKIEVAIKEAKEAPYAVD